MVKSEINKRQACIDECEAKYIKCVRRTYTGCVEVLRACRDKCPDK